MHLTHSITYWLLTWNLLYVAIHIMLTILVNLTFRRPIRREKSLVRAGRVRTVRDNLRKPYNLGSFSICAPQSLINAGANSHYIKMSYTINDVYGSLREKKDYDSFYKIGSHKKSTLF